MKNKRTSIRAGWSFWISGILALGFLTVLQVRMAGAEPPHDSHKQHHAFYQDWKNGERKGCCNDRDCRALAEGHERIVKGELIVYIQGVGVAKGKSAWCPVLLHHYLSAGNAPDWSTSHVCVTDHYGGTTPCAQFICYLQRPQS